MDKLTLGDIDLSQFETYRVYDIDTGFPIADVSWQPSRWRRLVNRLLRRKGMTHMEAVEAVNAYHSWDNR